MSLIERDLKHIWHPCSQMKDYETFAPLHVVGAEGAYFHLQDGRKVIDAISSWWCKSLGHQHPRLKAALLRQVERFEHVLLANTTNDIIVSLAEKLAGLTQNLGKVFFANDGSSAMEIAIKMSLHARLIQGEVHRTRFVALQNSYHGETLMALSASDVGLYRQAYEPLLTPVAFLQHIPYVSSKDDPLWSDCGEHWQIIEMQLNQLQPETVSAILVEPIVQGTGGMLLYSQDFLRRLRQWATAHGVHLIADEIMTCMGRTGYALACEHAGIEPDFLCLGKGLTSGWLPLSTVLTSDAIYDLFYADYSTGKSFLHSHTFTGNALAVAVALECLTVMEEENIYARVRQNETVMHQFMQEVAEKTGQLQNIRHIGAVVAADLRVKDQRQRVGYAVYQNAIKLGAFLRPLGNTLYWLPPLNVSIETLEELRDITIAAITQTLPKSVRHLAPANLRQPESLTVPQPI